MEVVPWRFWLLLDQMPNDGNGPGEYVESATKQLEKAIAVFEVWRDHLEDHQGSFGMNLGGVDETNVRGKILILTAF